MGPPRSLVQPEVVCRAKPLTPIVAVGCIHVCLQLNDYGVALFLALGVDCFLRAGEFLKLPQVTLATLEAVDVFRFLATSDSLDPRPSALLQEPSFPE